MDAGEKNALSKNAANISGGEGFEGDINKFLFYDCT
jgi:hypothetical protein